MQLRAVQTQKKNLLVGQLVPRGLEGSNMKQQLAEHELEFALEA
jgi:hypothetical protein